MNKNIELRSSENRIFGTVIAEYPDTMKVDDTSRVCLQYQPVNSYRDQEVPITLETRGLENLSKMGRSFRGGNLRHSLEFRVLGDAVPKIGIIFHINYHNNDYRNVLEILYDRQADGSYKARAASQ